MDAHAVTENRERDIYRVTLVGSVVNVILLILKFVAGILGKSGAMIADAVHSLSDFVTDLIVIIFVRISGRPVDKDHDYGHGKFETLATLIIGTILLGVGLGICVNGLSIINDGLHGAELPRPGMVALIVAIASIVLKEGLYHYTVIKGRKLMSKSVIANAWHHRSDAYSSIGTLLGIAGAMFLGDKWRVLDPIAAVLVSIFIMHVAVKIMRPCVDELLERSLPDDVEQQITDTLMSVEGVLYMHHLRTRRIGNNIAIEAHLKMDGNITLREAHDIATEAEQRIRERFGAKTHIGIHMEPMSKKG